MKFDTPLVVDRDAYEDARSIATLASKQLGKHVADTFWVTSLIKHFPDEWLDQIEPAAATPPSIRMTPRLEEKIYLKLRTIEHTLQGRNLLETIRTNQVFNGMLALSVARYDLQQWVMKDVAEKKAATN